MVLTRSLIVLTLISSAVSLKRLKELHNWRSVDFNFPDEATRNRAIQSGEFVPGNSLPLDVDVFQDRVFVTFPRWRPGIPATLGVIPGNSGSQPTSPKITPYPDWSSNREGQCDGRVTSVFRMSIDTCGRLWAIDSGVVDILGQFTRACPTQLVVFDLSTDRVIKRYRVPDSVLLPGRSLLVTVATDIRGSCDDAYAYLADVTGFGIIVYDYRRDRSWRVENNYFYPYPLHGKFTVNGESFRLMDGVLGLAVSPLVNGDKTLYFHSLASVRESWVPTSIILNERNASSKPEAFQVSEPRSSQSAGSTMDNNGILFFGLLGRNSIACWNSRAPYNSKNIVEMDQDNNALQFASSVKVDHDQKQKLYVVTCTFQSYWLGTINNDIVNFRILGSPVSHMVRGTACETHSDSISYPSGYGGSRPKKHH